MKKIGVALSTFNKIEEVAINVEIIRKHWASNNDAFISVCCNDPSSYEAIKKLDIDAFSTGETDWSPGQPKQYLRFRQFESIRNSVSNCASEFAVHYHCDAMAAKAEAVLKIVDSLKDNNQFAAYRGRGPEWPPWGKPGTKWEFGEVDDHFVFFDCEESKKRELFNQPEALNQLKQLCIEGFLSKTFKEKFKSSELYYYSNFNRNNGEILAPADEPNETAAKKANSEDYSWWKTAPAPKDGISTKKINGKDYVWAAHRGAFILSGSYKVSCDEERQFCHCNNAETMKNKLFEYGIKI